MRWFRHFVGMMRDPKLVGVAARCRQPVERVAFLWGCILEAACEREDAGAYVLDADELAELLMRSGGHYGGDHRNGRCRAYRRRQGLSVAGTPVRKRPRSDRDLSGSGASGSVTNGQVTDMSRVNHAPQSQTITRAQIHRSPKNK